MKKKFALLKSKAGMTFVELLTALALLVIIITSFTPMLLNSYETLYKAGEINEKTYISKTEIEESLTTRDSEVISNFKLEFENLANNMFIKMRAAIEDIQNNERLQSGIQTFYYGGNGYIKVVSPSVIPDNEPYKEIAIQFKGIKIDSVVKGGADAAKVITSGKEDEYVIAVEVVLPNTSDGGVSEGELFDPTKTALTYGQYSVEIDPKNPKNAIIKIYESVDVVTSLVQINAHYLDENKEPHSATAYVKITPANIMLVGGTTTVNQVISYKNSDGIEVHKGEIPNVAYYTSAGLVEEKDDAGVITGYTFDVYPRTLSTLNTPDRDSYIYADNENLPFPKGTEFNTIEWIDTDNSAYLAPYYVMTGNNGVIQRLFLSNGSPADASAIVGKTLTSASYEDGGMEKILTPTFWGGDRSHQFGFSSYKGRSSYGSDGDDCWYTQDTDTQYRGSADYDIYSSQARIALFYNGFGTEGTNYEEICRNGRKISYIIMEKGVPLRLSGIRKSGGNSWGGFVTTWENPQHNTLNYDGVNYPDQSYNSSDPCVVRVVRYNQDWEKDSMLAYLNIKSFGNLGVNMLFDVGSLDDSRPNLLSEAKATELNVTAAMYNSASGEMMYLGSSAAYAYVQQVDNTNTDENYANRYQLHAIISSNRSRPEGSITGYLIYGNDSGGTTVKKASGGSAWEDSVNALKSNPNGTLKTNAAEFYVQRPGSSVTRLEYSDVEFTIGYSSNREQVFANITYGSNLTEYHNSYERYYNLTHYGNLNRSNQDNNTYVSDIVKNPGTYINHVNNDMYNVWFPGEFYNLTHTATKDGITIAVGYAVSGSTYQWINPSQKTNTSTGLGSIYNDGVLAIMTDADESFKNLLYYKEMAGMQNSDITSNSTIVGNYDDQYGSTPYGTHARQSVRFTAVDVYTLGEASTEKSYYAVYGDNHGRVFYSLVAQTTGSNYTVVDRLGDSVGNYGSIGGQLSSANQFTDTKGQPLSAHFSEITNITVDDTVIYVTGRGNGADHAPKIAIAKNIPDNDLTFTVIDLAKGIVNETEKYKAEAYLINDMMNLNGSIYIAGEISGTTKGFCWVVSTATLTHCVDSGYDSIADYVRELGLDKNTDDAKINPTKYSEVMASAELPTKINSIAGNAQ